MTETEKALACLEVLAAWRADRYESWIAVGMALKSAGASLDAWDTWSRQSGKYQPGACERKWNSFNGSLAGGVTLGTIAAWALEDNDGQPTWEKNPGQPLNWESEIGRDRSTMNRPSVHNEPTTSIPDPAADWAPGDLVRYLEALYQPEECVSYAVESRQEADGRWVPSGLGNYWQTRTDLVARINKYQGDLPSAIGSWRPECGAWIRPNPMDGQGIKNDNVSDYRHVLVEADSMPIADQLAAIRRLQLPCAAIVHSGGKSIHAIVKIDAGKDYQLYRRRIATLFDALREIGFEPDRQCRNPARLSRMPGIERAGKPQYLIALQTGLPSWQAWEAWRKAEEEKPPDGEPLPQIKTLAELVRVQSGHDPDELLKYRYLSRGGGLLLVAQTGAGKSSFVMQAAMLWALERPFFGITPARPLRTLIVQAENDEGDMAEMRDGVLESIDLDAESRDLVLSSVRTVYDNAHTSHQFGQVLRSLLTATPTDLLVIDPALAYLGGDSGQQKDVSLFLRNILNPILTEFRIGLILVHHTTKPPKGDERSKWQGGDFAYLGAGAAEWGNWARGIINIEAKETVYKLRLPKRGKRIGWRDAENNAEVLRYIAHAKDPAQIYWREADFDEIPLEGDKSAAGASQQRTQTPKPPLEAYLPLAVELSAKGPVQTTIFRASLDGLTVDDIRMSRTYERALFDMLTKGDNPPLAVTKKRVGFAQFIGAPDAILKLENDQKTQKLNF